MIYRGAKENCVRLAKMLSAEKANFEHGVNAGVPKSVGNKRFRFGLPYIQINSS